MSSITLIKDLNRESYTIIFITHILSNLLNEASQFALIHEKQLLTLSRNELLKSTTVLEKIYRRDLKVEVLNGSHYLHVGDRRES